MKLFERVYQCPHCLVWHSSLASCNSCDHKCRNKKEVVMTGLPIVMGYECTLCKTISLTIKHDCKGGR
jgi:hypothetical protein